MKFQEVQESGEGAVKCAQIAHAGGGRELPILFSPAMARALPPRGSKSQTRRTRGLAEINESPDDWTVESTDAEAATLLNRVTGELRTIRCPYGPAGTRLWVKEGWRPEVSHSCGLEGCDCGDVNVTYLADRAVQFVRDRKIPSDWTFPKAAARGKGVTALFMPRWASRFTFINTGWRLERVQEITEADAIAEGLWSKLLPEIPEPFYMPASHAWYWGSDKDAGGGFDTAVQCYACLWDVINGKKLPFSRNGWVWVIGFEPEGGAK